MASGVVSGIVSGVLAFLKAYGDIILVTVAMSGVILQSSQSFT